MKKRLFVSAAIVAMVLPGAFAQVPDGKDIATAIPYSIGQVATGIGDSATAPRVVYAVKLAKGQTINVAAVRTSQANGLGLSLLTPQALTVATARFPESVADSKGCCDTNTQIDYLVPATGTYYIVVFFPGRRYWIPDDRKIDRHTDQHPQPNHFRVCNRQSGLHNIFAATNRRRIA